MKNPAKSFFKLFLAKRESRFYYISFGIRHPFSFVWTGVPKLSMKLSNHFTLEETKLKLKITKLKGKPKLNYLQMSLTWKSKIKWIFYIREEGESLPSRVTPEFSTVPFPFKGLCYASVVQSWVMMLYLMTHTILG